ncbi:MAG: hypothetical protein CSA61_01210 [Neptuniibacter caesariensis]|uniref:MSHA biogenesis protein MshJ n=1 Tax=Neptuniibacter caesariensis TaxID=207954 RepID=A0A2G6JAT2_NEPCE|nr:MAG: hypothetical protein CSA61_01210 [Neptuniibacter caesariensis]
MTKGVQGWSDKWNGLSKRERLLMLLTITVIPLALVFILLIEPALITLDKTPPKINALKMDIEGQQRIFELLQGQEVRDPNVEARAELRQLRQQLSNVNSEIKRAATNLVSPDQMLALMHSVLEDNQGIKLVSARSLGVKTMNLGGNDTAPEGEDEPKTTIFVHPFEIELKGTYQGLYNYLQKIEQLDGVFFWDMLEYTVDEHPQALIRIKVHTLSSEAGWLGA